MSDCYPQLDVTDVPTLRKLATVAADIVKRADEDNPDDIMGASAQGFAFQVMHDFTEGLVHQIMEKAHGPV